MNTRSAILVRLLCMLMLSTWTLHGTAQGKNGELTKDFDKLSPKERSRIAAQETKEAAEDSGYQALMREADQAFQAARYEEALAIYKKARVMRPYNVYPKVKIQDLQVLIKKRDLEKAAEAPSPVPEPDATEVQELSPPSAPAPEAHPPAAAVAAPVATPTPVPATVATPSPLPTPASTPAPISNPEPVEDTRPVPTPVVTKDPVHTSPAPRVSPIPLGERVYVEAGAVVTERTVEDDGKVVIYRKVVHAWGQTFYFKEGLAISQFQWDQRFSE